MTKITKLQQMALLRKWQQNNQGKSYKQFRKTIQPEIGSSGAIMVHYGSMWLGIETNGHTHS